MSTSPARAAAFDVLFRVERDDSYASELLHAAQFSTLSSADHALTTELVMGVLRWRSLLDNEISRFSSKSINKLDIEVLTALRLAAYQLLFLDRIPGRAAVHESVELVKRARKGSAAPFANAVLRKLANASTAKGLQQEDSSTALALSQHLAHPLWLVERWVRQFGLERAREICNSDQHAPTTALRLTDAATEAELKSDGIDLAPGQLISSARCVRAGNVSGTRAFIENRVAIQDEASQLVGLLVGNGSKILDCCAAPGGKTRVLAERNPKAGIIALELHEHRARLLRKLVPAQNVEVINSNVLTFSAGLGFDRVLADVPCSGTGTLAHNPEIKWRLKPENLADLHARQLAILRAAMRQVVPAGRVIYSTCSLEREENEDVVEKAISAQSGFRKVDCREELKQLRSDGELAWSDLESLMSGSFVRTIPGVHPCDGFFAAILEKY